MSPNKKILVRAYINENLGDDLFLDILFNRYKDVDFFLLNATQENARAFQEYSNVYHISAEEFLGRHKEFDGYVDIGGSIFIQEGKGLGGFRNRFLISLLLRLRGKQSFILGANFGPYNTNYFKGIYKYYFKFLVKDICFRDESSYHLFSDLKNVRYAPDIVFQLGENMSEHTKIKGSLGISVMDIRRVKGLGNHYDEYVAKMLEIVQNAVKNDMQVYLVSFCNNQGDNKVIEDITDLLDVETKAKIKTLEYNGDIKEFLKVYSTFESAVALRFHSFILSLICKQKVYPLIYSKKTLNVIEDIDSPISYCKVQDLKNKSVDILFQEMKDNSVNIKNLVDNAKQQFKVLDEYIKDIYEYKR